MWWDWLVDRIDTLDPVHVAIDRMAHTTVASCYAVIPVGLWLLVRRCLQVQRLPRQLRLGTVLLVLCIWSCGVQHWVDACLLSSPMFRLRTVTTLLCAACSVATAAWLLLLALPSALDAPPPRKASR